MKMNENDVTTISFNKNFRRAMAALVVPVGTFKFFCVKRKITHSGTLSP